MLFSENRFALELVTCLHRTQPQPRPYIVDLRPSNSIVIYLRGGHTFYLGDRVETAKAGDCVFIPFGQKYVNYPISDELEYYQVEFILYDKSGKARLLDDWCSLTPEQTIGLLPLLTELYRDFADVSSRKMFMLHAKLAAFIGSFVDVLQSRESIQKKYIPIRRTADRLDSEYMLDTPISRLASELSISISGLEKGFAEYYGCSPSTYRNNRRIEQAKLLLAEGHSVSDTAAAVGFGSVYYFSRFFKQSCGLSPSEYARSFN